MHLVLKFKYDDTIIEEVLSSQKPTTNFEKRYGDSHRLFPYCLFNCLQEERISWTYQNNGGRVTERIELMVTLMKLSFSHYFPQVISVICLKVGTDGTGQTGRVNLLPEGSETPIVDTSCFTKQTSEFYLNRSDPESFTMKTYVRDLRKDTLGNHQGIYTRVYTTMIFDHDDFQNRFRYTVLSVVMLNATALIGLESNPGVCAQNGLAVAFLTVGLLFSLPNSDLCTAAVVIVSHCLYEMLLTAVVTVDVWKNGWSSRVWSGTLASNLVVTLATVLYKFAAMRRFSHLRRQITKAVRGGDGIIGSFAEVDQFI